MNVYEKIAKLLLIHIVTAAKLCSSSEVLRPHGVSVSRAPLYSPDTDFTCFDNSKTIPFSRVNDDYCDCADASDEPGTSACPNGLFHCLNAGHKPLNLLSSRVNDGLCDCCDGSDEYASGVSCVNNCVELGKTAREEALLKEELYKVGKQLREELSQKGIQEKQWKKEKLLELEKNKAEAELVKSEKERLKNEAEDSENKALKYYRDLEEEEKKKKAEIESLKERTEALNAFNKYDTNQDGKITCQELQQHETFDKDKNGEVTIEEAKYFLNDQDELDQEKFVEDAWHKIKPYLLIESETFKKTPEPHEDEEAHDDDENQEEEPPNPDSEDEHEEEEDQPETQEEIPSYRQYDEETQRLVDAATEARKEFEQADSAIRDIETEIKDIREYLDKDFGSDEEFAPLKGQCFDYTDHEYTYKLCPFDRTVQQPKSGSAEVRLGEWGKWSGPDANKYESMLYERGQACWNGPQRSTQVKVSCGSANQLISVAEPNKCEYVFEFLTPAACRDEGAEETDKTHDEL